MKTKFEFKIFHAIGKVGALIIMIINSSASFCQRDSISLESKIIGTWEVVQNFLNNEVAKDYNPTYKDVFVFYAEKKFMCSDNEYGYKQSGDWKILDENSLIMVDNNSKETTTFDLIFNGENQLRLLSLNNYERIEIELVRKE